MPGGKGLLGQFDGTGQQALHLAAGVAHLGQQAGADLRKGLPGEVGIEVVGGLLQLATARRHGGRAIDPVLHFVVGKHQDRQHPLRVQRHEFDLAEGELTSRLGTLTMPTKWVIADSSSEALPSRAWVPAPVGSSVAQPLHFARSPAACICSSESTNSR